MVLFFSMGASTSTSPAPPAPPPNTSSDNSTDMKPPNPYTSNAHDPAHGSFYNKQYEGLPPTTEKTRMAVAMTTAAEARNGGSPDFTGADMRTV